MEINLVVENALTTCFDLVGDFLKNINGWATSIFGIFTLDAQQLVENLNENSPLPDTVKEVIGGLIRSILGETTLLSLLFSAGITAYLIIQIAKWITDLIN